MSNKSKNHGKKWLISRLKTSGSKRRYIPQYDYSETRNSKRNNDWENLPVQEGMGKSFKYFFSKINYGPLVRFLRGKVGCDWDEVHREILERIPTDLMEYKDCVQWFVADLVERREGWLWDKRENFFIRTSPDQPVDMTVPREFYVDPGNNTLVRISDFPSRRKTRGMDTDELRAFREEEQKAKLKQKRTNKSVKSNEADMVKAILKGKHKK